jgi:TatA/E family protein of Tat protein translocase
MEDKPWEKRASVISHCLLAGEGHASTSDKGVLMFEGLLRPVHLPLILGVAPQLFGPRRLPALGKRLGDGIRGFGSAMKEHGHYFGSEGQKL